jgi:hypothetical protein
MTNQEANSAISLLGNEKPQSLWHLFNTVELRRKEANLANEREYRNKLIKASKEGFSISTEAKTHHL